MISFDKLFCMTTLILMRHGKSAWNEKNLFTGWVDIPLTEKGIQESLEGGKRIQNLPIDVCFTSTLVRAQMTLSLALLHHKSGKVPVFLHPEEPLSKIYGTQDSTLPVHISSALNERMYGELQGLNKAETAQKFGADQVQKWRRSYRERPPGGESLQMTAERTIPYFEKQIVPELKKGKHVFVCAHGNSLRSIVMVLEQLSEEEVVQLEIPTGDALVFQYDQGKWSRK